MAGRLPQLTMAAAGLLLAIATGLGAYAAHGLDTVLAPDRLRTFEIAVDYQFVHGLGLLLVGLLLARRSAGLLIEISAPALFVGTLFFCGGLYASALEGPTLLRSLAPIGGSTLIVGWVVLAVGALRLRSE
jgi:uncharacterized membrane protein YgdD (TMEM256/DUF423 family)